METLTKPLKDHKTFIEELDFENEFTSITNIEIKNETVEEWQCKHCGETTWHDGGTPSPTAYPACIYPRHFWISTGRRQTY